MGEIKKIGAWGAVSSLTNSLKRDLESACKQSAAFFGLIAERIAKDHIANQDLNWAPLNEDYLEQKVRDGYSDFTLVRTSTYMQAITAWHEPMRGYAGVKRMVTYQNDEGENVEIANIAKIHEYGTDEAGRNGNVTIPARPLWGPTFKETMEKWGAAHTPMHKYQTIMKSKYR